MQPLSFRERFFSLVARHSKERIRGRNVARMQKTTCPYCGVGCGVEVNAKGIVGDACHPANAGSLCVKGVALAESLNMPSRLLFPKLVTKQRPQGQEVQWQQATDLIAEKIHQAKAEFGPDSVAMYVSGQLLTEDYYVANKLMKGYVGSANIDTNSRLCMSSAVAAHVRAFGEDVVPVNYDDIDKTELLIICGANTAWTHPVLFRRIQQARENNPNLKLVVIDRVKRSQHSKRICIYRLKRWGCITF